jgi:hypothetical protein
MNFFQDSVAAASPFPVLLGSGWRRPRRSGDLLEEGGMDSGGRPVNAVLNPENFDPASFGQAPGDPALQAPGNPEAQALTAR